MQANLCVFLSFILPYSIFHAGENEIFAIGYIAAIY